MITAKLKIKLVAMCTTHSQNLISKIQTSRNIPPPIVAYFLLKRHFFDFIQNFCYNIYRKLKKKYFQKNNFQTEEQYGKYEKNT